MSEPGGDWRTTGAGQVAPGDRVRVGGRDGIEVTVSRVEQPFLGREAMLAFIEDTEQRWLKVPVAADADVEVRP